MSSVPITVTNPASTPELASDCAIFPALPPTLSIDFVGAVNFPDKGKESKCRIVSHAMGPTIHIRLFNSFSVSSSP
jgi:hypothetical protein